jgi:hypothetical protein
LGISSGPLSLCGVGGVAADGAGNAPFALAFAHGVEQAVDLLPRHRRIEGRHHPGLLRQPRIDVEIEVGADADVGDDARGLGPVLAALLVEIVEASPHLLGNLVAPRQACCAVVQLRRVDALQAHRDMSVSDHRPPGLADHAGVVENMGDPEAAAILGEGERIVRDGDPYLRGVGVG